MPLEVIILAAGKGARMRSTLPKTLHCVGGRPMLQHVIETANSLAPDKIHLVVGHHRAQVKSAIELALSSGHAARDGGAKLLDKIHWVTQEKQLGTGHAVMQALAAVDRAATLLILYGDVPLVSAATLRPLVAPENALGLVTVTVENPAGLGRIVRDRRGKVAHIVEEKDATEAQRRLRECNAGFIAGPAGLIADELAKLDNDNARREFYLTAIIDHAAAAGVDIADYPPATAEETFGVNSQADLARVERIFQRNQALALLEQGVCLRDPARFDLRGHCEFGRDCVVDVNVILEGEVAVGAQCSIGANTIVRNSRIGAGSVIEANCVIDNAVVGEGCRIGPFARLRPQTELERDVHIGNFVEIKKTRIGRGSKANHLSYVGDSTLGAGVNIGAGVITCNYDGADKHPTVIGDGVFVGSNSQLVAPLTIGAGATIGAGSTITENVAAQTLAVSRARQKTIDGWVRPVKKRS